MSSLRKGPKRTNTRPVISGPIQDGVPVPRSAGGGKAPADAPVPRPRPRPPPQAGGKTSDYVKRRYSTRYNIPDNFDVTAAPPMPAMPAIDNYEPFRKPAAGLPVDASRSRGGAAAGGGAPSVNLDELRNPRFVAEDYVNRTLANATEDEIRDFEEQLQKMEQRAAADLQQNVYQNRTQFIKISKEAETLKGQMRALKNLMSELKTNTTVLRSASSRNNEDSGMNGVGFSSGLSKRDKRSSVADRTALWNSQMQVSDTYQPTTVSYSALHMLIRYTGTLQICGRIAKVPA